MSQNEIIRRREEPIALANSSIPSQRLPHDSRYVGVPLKHGTNIYHKGTQTHDSQADLEQIAPGLFGRR